jgi:hypothetical protein
VKYLVDQETWKTYAKLISRPIDLSRIKKKIHQYKSFGEFEEDIQLMLENCRKFHEKRNQQVLSVMHFYSYFQS